MSPSLAGHFCSVVECVDSSSFLGLADPVDTYVPLSWLKRIIIDNYFEILKFLREQVETWCCNNEFIRPSMLVFHNMGDRIDRDARVRQEAI